MLNCAAANLFSGTHMVGLKLQVLCWKQWDFSLYPSNCSCCVQQDQLNITTHCILVIRFTFGVSPQDLPGFWTGQTNFICVLAEETRCSSFVSFSADVTFFEQTRTEQITEQITFSALLVAYVTCLLVKVSAEWTDLYISGNMLSIFRRISPTVPGLNGAMHHSVGFVPHCVKLKEGGFCRHVFLLLNQVLYEVETRTEETQMNSGIWITCFTLRTPCHAEKAMSGWCFPGVILLCASTTARLKWPWKHETKQVDWGFISRQHHVYLPWANFVTKKWMKSSRESLTKLE